MGRCLLKLDLCIWTLNSGGTLDQCLASIDKAVPAENVCHKIAVDGGSRDNTLDILRNHGWTTYSSPSGIARQANAALSKVDTEFFATFEHDIILQREWFGRMAKLIELPQVACAQGIRNIVGIRGVDTIERWRWQKTRKNLANYDTVESSLFGYHSLDNNLFRTEAVRKAGGFPYDCPISVDRFIHNSLIDAGYKWMIDLDCQSQHVRKGLLNFYRHGISEVLSTKYLAHNPEKMEKKIRRFLKPPAIRIFKDTHDPAVIPVYFLGTYINFILNNTRRKRRIRLTAGHG
jgi:glycosyltransferase involved in cell wall biosynthesis